jgi:hypothetical protein
MTNSGQTLTSLQALGLEINSRMHPCDQVNLASLNSVVRNGDVATGTATGGDDFRPVGGSPLINAGDNGHCPYIPNDGHCDIGAWEFGQERVGPPLMTERFFIAGDNSRPVDAAPTADTPQAPPTPSRLRIIGE